jgi:hypothetical protein
MRKAESSNWRVGEEKLRDDVDEDVVPSLRSKDMPSLERNRLQRLVIRL